MGYLAPRVSSVHKLKRTRHQVEEIPVLCREAKLRPRLASEPTEPTTGFFGFPLCGGGGG